MIVLGRLGISGKIFMSLHLPDNGKKMDFPLSPVSLQCHLPVVLQLLILFFFYFLFFLSGAAVQNFLFFFLPLTSAAHSLIS